MSRLNAIEWDVWNPDHHELPNAELESSLHQLNDYWLSMVDFMVSTQDDK